MSVGRASKLGEVPAVTLPAGKPVAELDALANIIDLMLATRLAPDRIRPLVESLARREPKSARAAIFAARLAQAQDDDAAFEPRHRAGGNCCSRRRLAARRELAQRAARERARLRADEHTQHRGHRARPEARACSWYGEAVAHNNDGRRGAVGIRHRGHAARQESRSRRAGAARRVRASARRARRSPCHSRTSRDGSRSRKR